MSKYLPYLVIGLVGLLIVGASLYVGMKGQTAVVPADADVWKEAPIQGEQAAAERRGETTSSPAPTLMEAPRNAEEARQRIMTASWQEQYRVFASENEDVAIELNAGGDNDFIDGGADYDTVIYSKPRANYIFFPGREWPQYGYEDTIIVYDTGTKDVDVLVNVEAIRFADEQVTRETLRANPLGPGEVAHIMPKDVGAAALFADIEIARSFEKTPNGLAAMALINERDGIVAPKDLQVVVLATDGTLRKVRSPERYTGDPSGGREGWISVTLLGQRHEW